MRCVPRHSPDPSDLPGGPGAVTGPPHAEPAITTAVAASSPGLSLPRIQPTGTPRISTRPQDSSLQDEATRPAVGVRTRALA